MSNSIKVMERLSTPDNEEIWLRSLKSLNIQDTPYSDRFDRVTQMDSQILQVSSALFSLIDERV